MSAPSIAADDPQALFAFASNALLVAGQSLDNAAWNGSTLGASYPRRFLYYRRPPIDGNQLSGGSLAGWLGRGFTGEQGVEQFLAPPRTGGEWGFHTAALTVEVISPIAVQQNAAPPSTETMEGNTAFLFASIWAVYVGLVKSVANGVLVPPCGRALIGPFEPGQGGGGFATMTCAVSLQI